MRVHVIERPDPDGHRWTAALALLLEAGRAAPPCESVPP
jgi:hypothetical protein